MKPLDPTFNAACKLIAAHLLPNGWDVSTTAPVTYADLRQRVEDTGRFTVLEGFTEGSIFGDDLAALYASRAWHDSIHYDFRLPFTDDGERQVAWHHRRDLRDRFPEHPDRPRWEAIINALVIGQRVYETDHGAFPVTQHTYVAGWLHGAGYGRRPRV